MQFRTSHGVVDIPNAEIVAAARHLAADDSAEPAAGVHVSSAAGYRDVALRFQLVSGNGRTIPFEIRLDAMRSRDLLVELLHVHRLAWGKSAAHRPLDAAADEPRPVDILPLHQPS